MQFHILWRDPSSPLMLPAVKCQRRSEQLLRDWHTVCDINSHQATIDCVPTICRTKLYSTAFVEPSPIDVKTSYADVREDSRSEWRHIPSLKETSLAAIPLLEAGFAEDDAGFCTLGAGAAPDDAKVRSRSSSSISNLLFLTSWAVWEVYLIHS